MDETQALARLADILARPEFQTQRPPTFWQWLWRTVGERLLSLLAQLFNPVLEAAAGRLSWVQAAVTLACLLLIAAVTYFLARAVGTAVVRDSAAAAEAAAVRRARSDRLWQEAHDLARQGEFGRAVRALYLSALYALDEHAVLRIERGLTNREHVLRLAAAHPELAQSFRPLVERYDRLRYGGEPATEQGFVELSGLAARTRALAA